MEATTTAMDMSALNEKIEKESAFVDLLSLEMNKVIVGQKHMVERLLIGLLAQGHILLEGVPGLAKTLAINTLSQAVHGSFSRIQFTPDLLPADVIGTLIYNMKTNDFSIKKGPIFANFVLADEINRAPAKVQSALLEAMQEKQVTIGDETFILEKPFLVMATQNPIEQEGTYRLPEAQLDRFLFKIDIDYPNKDEEIEIINREHNLQGEQKTGKITSHLSKEQIAKFQGLVNQIIIESHLVKYIADIIVNTRNNPFLYLGASPRASIAILKASKAFAAMNGRDFVTPEDIKKSAVPVLQHRVIVTPEREMEGVTTKQIINQIIDAVEIPR